MPVPYGEIDEVVYSGSSYCLCEFHKDVGVSQIYGEGACSLFSPNICTFPAPNISLQFDFITFSVPNVCRKMDIYSVEYKRLKGMRCLKWKVHLGLVEVRYRLRN